MSRNDGRQTRRDLLASALALAGAATVGSLEARAQSPTGKKSGKDDLAGLQVFPADNPWNQDVSKSKVDPRSGALLQSVGLDKPLHPDFGTVYNNVPNGIPYVVVPGTQPKVPVSFEYADESDPGPYPIPPDAPIEGGPNGEGDRHILVVDRDHAKLYELFSARPQPGGAGGWSAWSGAIFDMKTGAMRPKGWTSADAAGLPIFPGLARYDEVGVRKAVRHALRFTVRKSRRAYVHPARHFASSHTDPNLPPMGMRVRLNASYDVSKFPPQARVILEGLKTYGMLLADNGGDWYLSGAPDPRWDDEDLGTLKRVKVRDFEVVMMGDVVTK
jgi:hypothetical protein